MTELTPTEPQTTPAFRPPHAAGFSAFGMTHRGHIRTSNEDACCVEPSLGLVVVADGVSGSAGGGIASRTAAETICEVLLDAGALVESDDAAPAEAATRRLSAAIVAAHQRIRKHAAQTSFDRMATTVTALWCAMGHAIVLHAGDSRAYRFRGGQLQQVTCDHTLVEEYRRRHGEVPSELAVSYGHIVTRCLSARHEKVELDVWIEPLEDGDAFVLCSDGLTVGVPDNEIAAVVGAGEPEGAVRLLIDMANAASGYDNVTVAIVRWTAPDHPSTDSTLHQHPFTRQHP